MRLRQYFEQPWQYVTERVTLGLAWWIEGLWLGLPRSLRERYFAARDELLVYLDDGMLQIERRADAEASASHAAPEGGGPQEHSIRPDLTSLGESSRITLILPDDARLTRTLELPVAARKELDRVLYFELDRLTPFDIDDCVVDYVTYAGSARDRLTVEFALVEKRTLDRHVSSARRLGVEPTAVTVRRSTGETLDLDLLGLRRRPAWPRLKSAPRPVVVYTMALAVVAALYVPTERYEALFGELEDVVDTQRARAVEARTLLDVRERRLAGIQLLLERESSHTRPVDLLVALTDALPDDTWLSRFTLSEEEVEIQGESVAASAVLEIIESTDSLHGAVFRSPVSRGENSGKQQFSVAARITKAN